MATREQLIEGVNKAYAAGDIPAANEIAAVLEEMDRASEPPPAPPETYVEGVQRRYDESDFSGIAGSFMPEVARRANITGDVTDLPATAISQAGRTGGELVMEAGGVVLPDIVREFASETFDGIMQTGYGQAAGQALSMGYEAYMGWRSENPAAAEKFETNVDVVSLLSPRPDLINLDAKALAAKEAGESASQAKRRTALEGLVEPDKKGTWDKTEQSGVLNTERWVPDDFSQEILTTLLKTPGIKPYGTMHTNFRAIQNAVESEKNTLTNYVKAQNRKIDTQEIDDEFVNAFEVFSDSNVYQLATEPAKKQFKEYVELARKIVREEGADLTSVLEARRKFDEAVHNSGKTLDADVATYQAEAAKLVRGVLNDYLKSNTSGDAVHSLLDLQFKQLVALDRMVAKRNREATNAIGRFKQRLTEGTGITIPATVLSVLATGGAVVDPAVGAGIAALGVGTVAGQQVARHGKKAVLQTYGYMLSATDKLIKSTNDPVRLEALELDRQVFVSMLEEARATEETNGGSKDE
jgi:hypothetical protein